MKCETTLYGAPCNEDATCVVRGTYIKPHLTCETHRTVWLLTSPESKPQFSPLPEPNNGDT